LFSGTRPGTKKDELEMLKYLMIFFDAISPSKCGGLNHNGRLNLVEKHLEHTGVQ
jgi:hypothetical protein